MTRLAIRLRLVAMLAAMLVVVGLAPIAAYAEDAASPAAVEEPQPQQAVEEPPPAVEDSPAPAAEEPAPPVQPEPAPADPVVESGAETAPPVEPEPSQTDDVPPPAGASATPSEPADSTDTSAPSEPASLSSETDDSGSETDGAESRSAARSEAGVTVAVETSDEIVVSVVAFDCAVAPVAPAPGVIPEGCTAADGLKFEATVGAVSLGTFQTGASGIAGVPANAGETLTIVEDLSTVTDGFAASSPTSEVLVAAGATLSLVHVATDSDPIPGIDSGRLQLTQGACPTSGEPRTELRYIAPQSIQAQADEGCRGVGGAEFLVEAAGDAEVSASAVEGIKRTDGAGNWRGELPVGSYVVTHVSSGQSVAIEVVLDEIAVVIAIDYVAQIEGSLSVRRFVCAGETESITISVSTSEPSPGDGCGAEDGSFQLNDGRSFTGGGDGAVTFELPIGSYQFQDVTTSGGSSTQIEVAEGATTWVMVIRRTTVGDISVQYNRCVDPASSSGDANDASFWAAACNNPVGGAQLGLVTAAGETVKIAVTDASGVGTWTGVANGSYRILDWSVDTTCAVFIGQQPALGGFQIAPGRIVSGQVYGCFKSAGNPGGGGPGGGGPGGEIPGNGAPGDGTGGTVTAPSNAPAAVPSQLVTQLPSTGASVVAPSGSSTPAIALMIAAIVAAFASWFALGLRRQP